MSSSEKELLTSGLAGLIGSQIFTRLATFGLNQIVTKALSVEAFGLLSIRFHLINTSILMLSREGFRRGCLVSHQGSKNASRTLFLSSWCIPTGLLVTVIGCWFFGPDEAETAVPGYEVAIFLQGAAAMIELVSEPLYILALVQSKIRLRVRIEASATLLKILATLVLLFQEAFAEAISISIAQVLFAVVTLIGYSWHFWTDFRQWRDGPAIQVNPKSEAPSAEDSDQQGGITSNSHGIDSDLLLCGNFSVQAAEKLLLAEGTKIAMTKVQSAYDQGVYGLVVNLGSIAARLLLQPFEEAAFMSFSQSGTHEARLEKQLQKLIPLLRIALLFGDLLGAKVFPHPLLGLVSAFLQFLFLDHSPKSCQRQFTNCKMPVRLETYKRVNWPCTACIAYTSWAKSSECYSISVFGCFLTSKKTHSYSALCSMEPQLSALACLPAGLLATAFGPSNTYLLLHLLYGSKYSATDAPTALALYCPYILLLAVNGILESFVQAVSRGPQLKYGHIALISITVIQGVATLGLVTSHGTFGMILADGLGMSLRIAYCLIFTGLLAKQSRTGSKLILTLAVPTSQTLAILLLAAVFSAGSLGFHFGRGWLADVFPKQNMGFLRAAAGHVAWECPILSACLLLMWKTERSVLLTLQSSRADKKDS